jgi:hypothetical protein
VTGNLKRELADLWTSILNPDAKRMFGRDTALLRTEAHVCKRSNSRFDYGRFEAAAGVVTIKAL